MKPYDVLQAGLLLVGEVLGEAEPGPDGKPGEAARKKAQKVLDALADPEALADELDATPPGE